MKKKKKKISIKYTLNLKIENQMIDISLDKNQKWQYPIHIYFFLLNILIFYYNNNSNNNKSKMLF